MREDKRCIHPDYSHPSSQFTEKIKGKTGSTFFFVHLACIPCNAAKGATLSPIAWFLQIYPPHLAQAIGKPHG
jgi:hypothetical protein